MGVFTPLIWGAFWDSSSRWVILLAPLAELIGAALLSIGLGVLAAEGNAAIAALMLLAGVLTFSVSKAGIAIAQFSLVGRVCRDNAALSFAVLILSKHIISIVATWGVPIVLSGGDKLREHPIDGLLHVSLLNLLPHALSFLSACALFSLEPLPPSEKASRRAGPRGCSTLCPNEKPSSEHVLPAPPTEGIPVLIPDDWEALEVGTSTGWVEAGLPSGVQLGRGWRAADQLGGVPLLERAVPPSAVPPRAQPSREGLPCIGQTPAQLDMDAVGGHGMLARVGSWGPRGGCSACAKVSAGCGGARPSQIVLLLGIWRALAVRRTARQAARLLPSRLLPSRLLP